MPNVACDTSSFLKSNCKYTRSVESESRSQHSAETRQCNERLMLMDPTKDHTCLIKSKYVQKHVLQLWTRWAGSLSGADRWTDTGLLKLTSQTGNDMEKKKTVWQIIKTSDITTVIDAVRPGQRKEKANWKQSKFVCFFNFSWSDLNRRLLCSHWG